MGLTDGLAILGAATGTFGMVWQVWSHRLTGGRVRLEAVRNEVHDGWEVRAWISNTGRQPVFVEGFHVWAQPKGKPWKRITWKMQVCLRTGLLQGLRTRLVHAPYYSVSAPAGYASEDAEVQFPVTVKPGETLHLPNLEISWDRMSSRPLKAAVTIGAGNRAVVADVLESSKAPVALSLGPADERYSWSVGVAAVWSTPDAGNSAYVEFARRHKRLIDALRHFTLNLDRVRRTDEIIHLQDRFRSILTPANDRGYFTQDDLTALEDTINDTDDSIMQILGSDLSGKLRHVLELPPLEDLARYVEELSRPSFLQASRNGDPTPSGN